MRRHPSSLLSAVLGVVALVAMSGASPVPSPVHVQPGVAADGTVAWVPAVQRITGPAGGTVAVDLALDHGGEQRLLAHVAARAVSVDPVEGPRATGRTDVLRLAVDRVSLRPGERGAFRAVAEMPARPTVVAVQARLDADASTGPLALVLLVPESAGDPAELTATIELDGARAEVRVENDSPFPALVDLAVSSATWVGATDDVQVGDVLVPPEGHRLLEVELSRGLGRRTAEVAVAQRGSPGATTRAAAAAWPPRTVWTVVAGVLVLLTALAALRVMRRS